MSSPLSSFATEIIVGIPGSNVSLSNHGVYLIISSVLWVAFTSIAKHTLIPYNVGLMSESLIVSINNMGRSISHQQGMNPLLVGVFGLIIMNNLVSNVPYSFSSMTSLSSSLGMSLLIFIGVTLMGIHIKGWSFMATFVPANTPNALLPLLVLIELVSYVARSVSLGIRLFANMTAGHTLLTIISSMTSKLAYSGVIGLICSIVPLGLLVGLVGLEIAVAAIQAYVFTVLTAIYIDEALKPLL